MNRLEFLLSKIKGDHLPGYSRPDRRAIKRHCRKMNKLTREFIKILRKRPRNTASWKYALDKCNAKWKIYCRKELGRYRSIPPQWKGFRRFIQDNKKKIEKQAYNQS